MEYDYEYLSMFIDCPVVEAIPHNPEEESNLIKLKSKQNDTFELLQAAHASPSALTIEEQYIQINKYLNDEALNQENYYKKEPLNRKEGSNGRRHKRYLQKYLPMWETNPALKDWISSSRKGSQYAYCKACDKHIRISGGRMDMIRHAKRTLHVQNIPKMDPTKVQERMEDVAINTFWHCLPNGSDNPKPEPIEIQVEVNPFAINKDPKEKQLERKKPTSEVIGKNLTINKMKLDEVPAVGNNQYKEESDSSCSCPSESDSEDEHDAYGKDIAYQLSQISDPFILSVTKRWFDDVLKESLKLAGEVKSVKNSSTNTPASIIATTNISRTADITEL